MILSVVFGLAYMWGAFYVLHVLPSQVEWWTGPLLLTLFAGGVGSAVAGVEMSAWLERK